MKLSELVARAREEKVTLLGVGPVSETVVQAALKVAREMKAPVIFLASRNQVETPEIGQGYVKGWSPGEMVEFIRRQAEGATYFLERDHGGPWQRDEERKPYLSEKEAFRRALTSYRADLQAGFHLLHIDPTRRKNTTPAQVIQDTLFLMARIEAMRKSLSLPPVDYEIGTEENYAGVMSAGVFRRFLQQLTGRLKQSGFPLPLFIVGQTGSLVRMDYNAG
ncbi:MAG TPA: class II D-tagatose-bisphosphate aldolase, non-catalytic subunit, partial [bacterium]|nr:class II D-tagatose-bisphosphate aldolase, non-catalytic subunit [bacterium]